MAGVCPGVASGPFPRRGWATDLADTADANHRAVRASLAAHGITVPLSWVAADPAVTAAQLRRRLGFGLGDLPDDSFVEAARAHWYAHTDLIRPIAAAATAARAAADRAAVAVVSANYHDRPTRPDGRGPRRTPARHCAQPLPACPGPIGHPRCSGPHRA